MVVGHTEKNPCLDMFFYFCGHTSKRVANLLAKYQCVFWSTFFKFSFYFGKFNQHEKGCTRNNLNESKIGARLAM